jgi:hypothetical protein
VPTALGIAAVHGPVARANGEASGNQQQAEKRWSHEKHFQFTRSRFARTRTIGSMDEFRSG